LDKFPVSLSKKGACFVTLRKEGTLRGCVGSIEAIQPLILDVQDRAVAAGFQDFRFSPLTLTEFYEIRIEISCLTTPEIVHYEKPEDLLTILRPEIDGVILKHQNRRATFLPQVWDQLPETDKFLDRLCLKMGLEQNAWRTANLQVETYQVQKFQEAD
jgi:AmmeMemoRadiSam system protein A